MFITARTLRATRGVPSVQPFAFNPKVGQSRGAIVLSEPIVLDITAPIQVTAINGWVSVGGGTHVTQATVNPGDSLQAVVYTDGNGGVVSEVTVVAGSQQAVFSATTYLAGSITLAWTGKYVYVGRAGLGTYDHTVPAGVTAITVEWVNGGAGGGGSQSSSYGGGGGGGGGWGRATMDISAVDPATGFGVSVGKGGNGGTYSQTQGQGGGLCVFTNDQSSLYSSQSSSYGGSRGTTSSGGSGGNYGSVSGAQWRSNGQSGTSGSSGSAGAGGASGTHTGRTLASTYGRGGNGAKAPSGTGQAGTHGAVKISWT